LISEESCCETIPESANANWQLLPGSLVGQLREPATHSAKIWQKNFSQILARTSNLPVDTTSLYSTGVSPTSISPAIAFFQPASATQASVSPLYQVYAFNFAPVFVSFTESASQLDSEPFVVETTSQYIRHSLCYGQQCVSSHEKNLNVCRTVINIL